MAGVRKLFSEGVEMSLAWMRVTDEVMDGYGLGLEQPLPDDKTRPAGVGPAERQLAIEVSREFHQQVTRAYRGSQWRLYVICYGFGFLFGALATAIYYLVR